jgi:hypothetical protein
MNIPESKCEICAKNFISEKNLMNHATKFHKEPINEVVVKNKPVTFACKTCNKEYKYVQSKNNHEKTCMSVLTAKEENEPPEIKLEKIKLEITTRKCINLLKKQERLNLKLQSMKRNDYDVNNDDDDDYDYDDDDDDDYLHKLYDSYISIKEIIINGKNSIK